MRGKCLCGAVEIEVLGPYPKLYQCHCSLCRKQGGSTSNTGMIVAAEKLRWLAGEDRISKFALATGFRTHFCRTCGCPVPNPLRDTGFVWVPSGLLDDEGQLEIAAQLYLGSRASWDRAPGKGQPFDTMPDMNELITLLHANR